MFYGFDAYGSLRATHSRDPLRHSHIAGSTSRFYAHVWAGHKVFHLLVSKLTVGLDFVTLASIGIAPRSLRRAGSKEHTRPHTSTVSL